MSSLDERLLESERFFMNKGRVQATLGRLADRLASENIPYAIIGGMALFLHGYVRETQDIDLILSPEGLREFHSRLVGRGYLPAFTGASKTFRDTVSKVKVEIITTDEHPGGRKIMPVSFPDPATSVERGGVRVVPLEKLIELKLASGLSAPHRMLIDLADVQRLIEELRLPPELADALDPSVQAEYRHLWE
ncbi:MAG: hypothetical protein HY784_17675, partial [Chloroflexi bacterium]|nr:hypothetical protein [Chloroflexota bacterium]